ncbi:pleiotropic drug resistance protein 3-like [Gossypium australe]|uniref:Pleiotropic drug resistance protein 3-like n=1 Tax=Gossypium australe TaxID=47621 RepID=A0A5B6VEV7_9ROSI|nr:pleiotropic drug resistance protein 3-like [Gossypium australe]
MLCLMRRHAGIRRRMSQRKIIGVKWVYRAKQNADGSLNKLKARLVVKGFSQRYGLDYMETFALIYVDQPQGFKVTGKEDMVYKLNKALYGLKQAPRACYSRIDGYLISLGFERSISEPTLYVKKKKAKTQLIVSLYVDDVLVTGGDQAMLVDFKTKMQQMFEMSDLGLMTYFLGMEVTQTQKGICLSQKAFAVKILNKFSMENRKATSTPVAVGEKLSSQGIFEEVCESTYRSLVGCLLYLIATRPDIMYAASLLSRFMHCCNESHFKATKRVLRYIKGTLSYGMLFSKAEHLQLVGYTDSDWVGSMDDMKSTSGYVFSLGSAMFCWSSRKQSLVAQSKAKVEYVAAVNQAIWLRKIMSDLNLDVHGAIKIYCDNKSVVAIAKKSYFSWENQAFQHKTPCCSRNGAILGS